MPFIELKNVSKCYNNRLLYKDVNLSIHMGDKVVILGENGVGKTTLLNIMSCETDVDSGNVKSEKDKIIFFNQLFDFPQNIFVDEYISQLFDEAIELEKQVCLKGEELSNNCTSEKLMQEYIELSDKFESKGGYSFLEETNKFINIFGINDMMGKRCKELSGGQKQYLRLALSLFSDKDVIFLDEPGSYLEDRKMNWLVNYIKSSSKTFVVISHDAYIARSIASKVISISNGEVNSYPCSYEKYLEEEERYKASRLQGNKDCDKEIHKKIETITKKMEWMRKAENKHRHAVTIRRMQKEIEKLKEENLTFDNNSYAYECNTSKAEVEKKLYVSITHIKKTFGSHTVLADCSLKIYSDSRLVVVGNNGSGKTTLMRIIAGTEIPEEGERDLERGVAIEMAEQEIPTEVTGSIIDYCVQKSGKGMNAVENALSRLFDERKIDGNSNIRLLSGGERKRLEILIKIISNPNLLILDEPTVYMDQYSRNCLHDLIDSFTGAILIVTHDDEFASHLLSNGFTILHMDNGLLKNRENPVY